MTKNLRDDQPASAFKESAALVRAESLDAWLSTLLAPASTRPALLGAWALALEVARLPWRLHEPLLARMRAEWWREALLALHAQTRQEASVAARHGKHETLPPALQLLAGSLAGTARPGGAGESPMGPMAGNGPRHAGQVDAQALAEAIARLALLADTALADAQEAEAFARESFTPLLRALCSCLDATATRALKEEDLQQLATAFGIAFLLRRLPHPRLAMPAPLLPEQAAQPLAGKALDAYGQARRRRWPRRLLPALWPVSLHLHWLQQARQASGFPATPVPAPSQLRRQLRLSALYLRGAL